MCHMMEGNSFVNIFIRHKWLGYICYLRQAGYVTDGVCLIVNYLLAK